ADHPARLCRKAKTLTGFMLPFSLRQPSGAKAAVIYTKEFTPSSRAERGLEVSVISIVDVEARQSFALSAEQTPPPPERKPAEKAATRIDFYLAHLARTAPSFPATVSYGVFDGFYAKQRFVAGVLALGYQVVSKLRSDARLLYLVPLSLAASAILLPMGRIADLLVGLIGGDLLLIVAFGIIGRWLLSVGTNELERVNMSGARIV
ncbi:MAG: hypothetical protein ACRD9R_15275, partial [Pyrinomonadaceae bacterium]